MAHQCLKCGKTYPDGSSQILKGCEGCRGTRFFYTDRPLDEAARESLSERTEVDLERLALGKVGELPPRHIPTKDELPMGPEGRDWVAGGPTYLRGVVEEVVRRAGERKPVFRMGGEVAPRKTLAEWIAEQGGPTGTDPSEEAAHGDAPDLLEDLMAPGREAEWRAAGTAATGARGAAATPSQVPGSAPTAPTAPEPEVVYRRDRPVPRPVSLAGVEVEAEEDARLRAAAQKAQKALEEARPAPGPAMSDASGVQESLYPEGQAPETVAVKDAGVYELDVKRLLEKSPIVVHRDGTYSLHLPSLMETLGRPKQR